MDADGREYRGHTIRPEREGSLGVVRGFHPFNGFNTLGSVSLPLNPCRRYKGRPWNVLPPLGPGSQVRGSQEVRTESNLGPVPVSVSRPSDTLCPVESRQCPVFTGRRSSSKFPVDQVASLLPVHSGVGGFRFSSYRSQGFRGWSWTIIL